VKVLTTLAVLVALIVGMAGCGGAQVASSVPVTASTTTGSSVTTTTTTAPTTTTTTQPTTTTVSESAYRKGLLDVISILKTVTDDWSDFNDNAALDRGSVSVQTAYAMFKTLDPPPDWEATHAAFAAALDHYDKASGYLGSWMKTQDNDTAVLFAAEYHSATNALVAASELAAKAVK
jgi:hypothetical protein